MVSLLQVDGLAAELERALGQPVLLVEIDQPLLGGGARVMRAVGKPLLHAQEVHELLVVLDDVEEVEVVLGHGADRRHQLEDRGHDLAGQVAEGVDQLVDVVVGEVAGPEVDEAVAGIAVLLVGVEVDRGDRQDQVLHLLGMPGGIERGKGAALADAEQRDAVDAGRLADMLDAVVEEPVDVVVDRQELVGARRVAPVDHPEVDAALEQVADQRAILLQVGHGVAADQPVDDQHRSGPDLDAGQRVVVVQRHLLDAHRLGLRRGADIDVGIADASQAPRRRGRSGHRTQRPRARTDRGGMSARAWRRSSGLAGRSPTTGRGGGWRFGPCGLGRRRRCVGSGIRGGEARVQRAHLATQLVDGAMQVVDLGAGRDRMGLAPDLDQLALLQAVGDAGGEQLALRLQELVGALGADQLVVGDAEPAVEHRPEALLQQAAGPSPSPWRRSGTRGSRPPAVTPR